MADLAKGYGNGDKCPKCGGLVTIRTMGGTGDKYAQCTKCSWNSTR